jgi:hypothetical protein
METAEKGTDGYCRPVLQMRRVNINQHLPPSLSKHCIQIENARESGESHPPPPRPSATLTRSTFKGGQDATEQSLQNLKEIL